MTKKPGFMDLRETIVVQRNNPTSNALNEPVDNWSTLTTTRANREDVSSGEKEAAGQVGAFLMARFTVRRSATMDGVKQADRIVHDGSTWSIVEIMRLKDAPTRFLVIKAVKDADS